MPCSIGHGATLMPKAKKAETPPTKPAKSPAISKAAAKPHTSANAVVNVPAVIITGAQASKLDLDGLAAGIRHTDSVYRGAYAAYGIYRFYAEKQLDKGKVTPFLTKKCGLSASTISHTAYACKAYHWVASRHITEDDYNRMTSRDMTAFIQAMGGNSKAQLKPDDAVSKLKKWLAAGADVAAEFDAYYIHGVSREAMEKLADEQKEKDRLNNLIRDGRASLGDGKFKDARKAANEVLSEDKDHAEAKRLLSDTDEAEKAKKNKPTTTTTTTTGKPTNGGTGPVTIGGGETDQVGGDDDERHDQTGGGPTNITQMPKQEKAKPTASDLGTMLDKLIEAVAEASAEDQRVFITSSWTAADALLRTRVAAKPTKKKAA